MRCFVALLPPRSLTDRVAGWCGEALSPLPWARPLPPESLHVTLAFLGELDAGAAERAGDVVAAVDQRLVELRLGLELVGVPRRRPRVLALAVTGERVASLRERVSGALVAADLLEPERRPFWPHLSVARVKRGALEGKRGRDAIAVLPRLPQEAAKARAAERLVLYRSQLGPERATYTELAEIELPEA